MALTRIISEIIQDNTIQDADISSSLSTGISGSFGSQRVSTTDNVQFNHITASGNISSSGTVIADNFQSTGGSVDGISFTDDLNITGNITASGDISGSSSSTGSFGRLHIVDKIGANGVTDPQTTIQINAPSSQAITSLDTGIAIEHNGAANEFFGMSYRDAANTRTENRALIGFVGGDSAGQGYGHIVLGVAAASGNSTVERMRVQNDGKVGIGNTTPSEMLTVTGNISSSASVIAKDFSGTFIGALSSSAQISANISGSFGNQRVGTADAVTFATVDTGQGANELYDMNQNVKTDSDVTFSNATITNTLSAQEIHTRFVSASVTLATGSNQFGDALTDVQNFTGSVIMS